MNRTPLVLLLAALAVAHASAARVEIVPDAPAPSAPAVTIAPVPLALTASPLAASAPIGSAPLAASAPALVAAMPAAAASPAPALIPVAAATPAAEAAGLGPSATRAAKNAAAGRDGSHPTLLQTLSAPAAEAKTLDSSGAEKDFAARAQLDAPDVGGGEVLAAASVAAPLARVHGAALQPAAKPVSTKPDAIRMETELIPKWMKEELPVAAAKLGRPLPAEYEADVLARSKVWVYKWHSRFTYEISGGLPDGHYDPKFGIRVMLKTDWRRLKDPETHFKVLYAHEYTHWLQEEGLVTRRYGGEIPAVAVEQLRAVELVGIDGMKDGKVGFIAENIMQSFEHGRQWARGDMKDLSQLYFRGVLGGVAYEVGQIAGRPEAAWEFLNLVIAEKGGLTPREAFERVAGRKK